MCRLLFWSILQYDRSGRSTGRSIIEFATSQQAKAAINQFDGAMTKGQTIAIKLIAPPRAPPKDAAGSSSLLQRLGGSSDLGSRLGGAGGRGRGAREPREPRDARDVRGGRGPREPREAREPREPREPRGERRGGGRGGRGGARGGKRGPANADDLDKELDGFMTPDASGDVAM